MAIVSGEAQFDAKLTKWFFVIYNDGKVSHESEHIFNSQNDAESALRIFLHEMDKRIKSDSSH